MAEGELPFRYIPPIDPNIGRIVDDYRLETLLGRGGMGAAYVGTHRALLRSKCVIKLVLAEIARHPQGIVRFQLEAEALVILNHDNIVKVLKFGVLEDGQLYLRLEFIQGKSLERYVAEHNGRLDLREAVYLIFQCCSALQYAHDLGVIHRDLKPDNIMIEFNPPGATLKKRIKILDFGIARVIASAVDPTGSGVVLGTPRFMAPEQVTNAATASGAADVFALGQILYWMLTGQMPWGIPESDIAIYHKQRTEPPTWPPEQLVPAAIATIIMKCLSLNPERRPTMRELATELAAAIPAEDGLESGSQILEKIVPDWVTGVAMHDAVTLPRPAVPEPILASLASEAVSGVPEDVRDPPPALQPEAAPSPDLTVTANQRPRGSASSPDAGAGSAARSSVIGRSPPRSAIEPPPAREIAATAAPGRAQDPPASATVASPDLGSRRLPAALMAALPTGLGSQRLPAQAPPIDARATPFVVAAEIELAIGTPGPLPYAHSELPAVLVSSTLSGLTPPPGIPSSSSTDRREPPPFVVLPGASTAPRMTRSAIGKLVLLVTAACAFVGTTTFVVAHLASRTTTTNERGSAAASDFPGPPLATVAVPPDAGMAANLPDRVTLRQGEDAGLPIDAAAAPESTAQTVSAPDSVRTTTARDAEPSRQDSRKDDPADGAPDVKGGAGRSTPPRNQDMSPPTPRAPSPRAPNDSLSEVLLVIRVRGFAKVSIDGDEPSASPRRKSVQAGVHHVVMTGYPDGSDEKKTKEFDVNVPVGRPELVIHKAW